jgi:nicotinamide N-methyltransferase
MKIEILTDAKFFSTFSSADMIGDEHYDFSIFQEPANFRPKSPEPQSLEFDLKKNTVKLKMVGKKHSLWGHRLWNAGKAMAYYLEDFDLTGKNIIEFGAASGLPSMACAFKDAANVVLTDYPDPELLNALRDTAALNKEKFKSQVHVVGFQWGQDVQDLLQISKRKYDLILMADLIFNHKEHDHLLASSKLLLQENGKILVTFTHHVVKWSDRDLKFFVKAQEHGFKVEKIKEEIWDCMFPEDQGDEMVRKTVHFYQLTLEAS